MNILRVWCGPMCSAKTTGALHVARRYARMGNKVVLVRPAHSRRGHEQDPNSLATKNAEVFPCFDLDSAEDVLQYADRAGVIWIDEPNHFADEEELIKIVPEVRKKAIVLVSGLGATSELEPFGLSMGFLLATADYVEWRTADCDACKNHGTATRSLYVGEAPKDGQLQVGGAESYRPVCPTCWTALMKMPPAERRHLLAVD